MQNVDEMIDETTANALPDVLNPNRLPGSRPEETPAETDDFAVPVPEKLPGPEPGLRRIWGWGGYIDVRDDEFSVPEPVNEADTR